MSEDDAPRKHTTRLRSKTHRIGATTAGTYQCTMEVSFETKTKKEAERVIAKLNGMDIYDVDSLVEQAVDLLQDDIEEIKKAGEILKLAQKEELAALMQNMARKDLTINQQQKELERLKKLEEQLERIAGLKVR
jgi:hypothetical protein